MGRLRCALLPGFTIPDDVTIVATWTDREQGTHWIVLEGDALPAWCPELNATIVPTTEVAPRHAEAREAMQRVRDDVWNQQATAASAVRKVFNDQPTLNRRVPRA